MESCRGESFAALSLRQASARAGQTLGHLPDRFDRSFSVGCHSQIQASTKRKLSTMSSPKLTRSMHRRRAASPSRAVPTASSASPPAAAQPRPAAAHPHPAAASLTLPGRARIRARSGPAAGGAAGTVASRSSSSFTLTTSAGQKVTIKETPATTYQKQASPASATAITTGEPSWSWGRPVNHHHGHPGHREPAGSAYTASSAKVIPFRQGAPRHVQAGRPDPGELHPGLGDNRQPNTRPVRRRKPRWPPTPAASSTVWSS